ncbi:enoyl-CoA delta isomerase 1, mitochondrial-like [Toxorhynchites rutilus septentrionalis]|uniref:enoyl-CoA delta isomerase 1, mitochondrial-like n=1 Tax=Toxorhynchites rutilus septentrionalis TaxID=329112 RepID=UPI00247A89D7|nr:enoyl-CoA delta isomerase 1, mitochondrial-like [Toxorhynchites rutilus septentrionalis]XP_055639857.1 enoyl-CoA delta isomerase 1, mitochondrial-like [Toxorhynchites rutilus septentrionalis]XP_055639858.1 enoyl-CoA delta isomerase 1, mitochondrial-like [Toxorhynchites rutilus septentrionalis]
MLRPISRSLCRFNLLGTRSCSNASEKLVITEVDDKTGYATVTLNRPPVNSLNLELLKSISEALDELQNNKSRGMILTSSSKTVFSAGLDIMEMYKPKPERLKDFWSTLQDVWFKLYGSAFPTVAAINGHSPAGGCLLALCCEYRIMCPNYTIGLNETQLGIVAPTWFQASMRNTISRRESELALTLGTLFSTDQALKVGLIDEIAANKEEAIAKAAVFLDKFRKISPQARAMTKQALRSKDIMQLEDNRSQDIDLFVYAVTQPKVQKSLELYLEGLKKRASA